MEHTQPAIPPTIWASSRGLQDRGPRGKADFRTRQSSGQGVRCLKSCCLSIVHHDSSPAAPLDPIEYLARARRGVRRHLPRWPMLVVSAVLGLRVRFLRALWVVHDSVPFLGMSLTETIAPTR